MPYTIFAMPYSTFGRWAISLSLPIELCLSRQGIPSFLRAPGITVGELFPGLINSGISPAQFSASAEEVFGNRNGFLVCEHRFFFTPFANGLLASRRP
jgi:hypothetical protein